MATPHQLKSRWKHPPGSEIQTMIFSMGLINAGHGRCAEELFQLLSSLPNRHEVDNGRDFRGLNMAACEIDLSFCNFAHGQISSFYSCNLEGSIFDCCVAERATFHCNMTSCSFLRTKLQSCYFDDSTVVGCDFSHAHLRGCSFQNANLRGSQFLFADCRQVTFAGADLTGCNFSGANLEEAVFCDVVLDKSTDFRGANISNVITTDWLDSCGNATRKGTDLYRATI